MVSAKLFCDLIEDNIKFVAHALRRIEMGETPDTDLHSLRIFLVDALDLIEPDPGITAAADDLYRIASECVHEQEREVLTEEEPHVRPQQARAVREALLRLREMLLQARPRDETHRIGLW